MARMFWLLTLFLVACGPPGAGDRRNSARTDEALSPVEAMRGADIAGYARADRPRYFVFPRDHGPHPEFQLEWWYFVGHLESLEHDAAAERRRFGYQLTFFRRALAPEMVPRSSNWAARELYMAHFALTDIDGEHFHSFERFNRAAAGLAGARAEPFAVWTDDWSVTSLGEGFFPLRLSAAAGGVGLELELGSSRPPVLQGEDGWSRKSAEPGDASYYYSFTRLAARGTVILDGRSFAVDGSGWLDREFSTSVLDEEQVGWDWFALQLEDGRDLMFFHLRRRDGSVEPLSHGMLVTPEGDHRPLGLTDVELVVIRDWTSPAGTVYPAGWLLTVPDAGLELELTPLLADQELDVSFRYWEGAVAVSGRERAAQDAASRPLSGRGYVELVGYGG